MVLMELTQLPWANKVMQKVITLLLLVVTLKP